MPFCDDVSNILFPLCCLTWLSLKAASVALFGRQEKSETMAKTQTPFSVAFLLVYLDLRSYVRRYAAMQR